MAHHLWNKSEARDQLEITDVVYVSIERHWTPGPYTPVDPGYNDLFYHAKISTFLHDSTKKIFYSHSELFFCGFDVLHTLKQTKKQLYRLLHIILNLLLIHAENLMLSRGTKWGWHFEILLIIST